VVNKKNHIGCIHSKAFFQARSDPVYVFCTK
jgi:hypothetical protein